MAVTGIYFIPASQSTPTLADLTDRFVHAYDPLPTGPWVLQHRLFRSHPVSPQDKSPLRLQHIVFLSHHGKAFAHIDVPGGEDGQDETMTVAIPVQQMDTYSQLLIAKFGALWHYRTGSQVTNGTAYAVGEFTVRIGEVREMGGQHAFRGVVVCVQAVKQEPIDGAEGLDSERREPKDPQALVREVWEKFNVQGAKEAVTSKNSKDLDAAAAEEVRLWCDILRLQK